MYKLKAQELIKFNVHMLSIVCCIVNNSHSTSQFPRTCISSSNPFNTRSPRAPISTYRWVLHVDHIRTFFKTSWENLLEDHSIFSLVIILLILITFSLDCVLTMSGENWFWSLLGLKGLTSFLRYQGNCVCPASWWRCNRNLAKLEVVYQSFYQTADTNHYIPVFQDQQARGTNHNLLLSCRRAG